MSDIKLEADAVIDTSKALSSIGKTVSELDKLDKAFDKLKDKKVGVNTQTLQSQLNRVKQSVEETAQDIETKLKQAFSELGKANGLTDKSTALNKIQEQYTRLQDQMVQTAKTGMEFPTIKVNNNIAIDNLKTLAEEQSFIVTQQAKVKDVMEQEAKKAEQTAQRKVTAANQTKVAQEGMTEAVKEQALQMKKALDTQLASFKNTKVGYDELKVKAEDYLAKVAQLQQVVNNTGANYKRKDNALGVTLTPNSVDANATNSLQGQLQRALNSALYKTGKSIDVKSMWGEIVSKIGTDSASFAQAVNNVVATGVQQGMSNGAKGSIGGVASNGVATQAEQNAGAVQKENVALEENKQKIAELKAERDKLIKTYTDAFYEENQTVKTYETQISAGKRLLEVQSQLKGLGVSWEKVDSLNKADFVDALKDTSIDYEELRAKSQALNAEDEKRKATLADIAAKEEEIGNISEKLATLQNSKNGTGNIENLKQQIALSTQLAEKQKEYGNAVLQANKQYGSKSTQIKDGWALASLDEAKQQLQVTQQLEAELAKLTATEKSQSTVTVASNEKETATLRQETQAATDLASAVDKAKQSTSTQSATGNGTGATASTWQTEIDSVAKMQNAIITLTNKINDKTSAIRTEAATMVTSAKTETEAVGKIIASIVQLTGKLNAVGGVKLNLGQAQAGTQAVSQQMNLTGLIPNISASAVSYADSVGKIAKSIADLNQSVQSIDVKALQTINLAIANGAKINGANSKNNTGASGLISNAIAKSVGSSIGKTASMTANTQMNPNAIASVISTLNQYKTAVDKISQQKIITENDIQKLQGYQSALSSIQAGLKNWGSSYQTIQNGLKSVNEQIAKWTNLSNKTPEQNATLQDWVALKRVLDDALASRQKFNSNPIGANGQLDTASIKNVTAALDMLKESMKQLTKFPDKLKVTNTGNLDRFTQKMQEAAKAMANFASQERAAVLSNRTALTNGMNLEQLTQVQAMYEQASKMKAGDPSKIAYAQNIQKIITAYQKQNTVIAQTTALLNRQAEAEQNAVVKSGLEAQAKQFTATANALRTFSGATPTSITEISNALQQVIAHLGQVKTASAEANSALSNGSQTAAAKLSRNYTELAQRMTDFREKNSKFMADPTMARTFSSIFSSVTNGANQSTQGLATLTSQFNQFKTAVSVAGATGRSVLGNFQHLFQRIGGNMLISTALFKVRSSVRELFSNVQELDTAMTKLKRVTDETTVSYNRFLDAAGETAQRIGTGLVDVVDATGEFAKLGYSLDEASKLSENALLFKNVADLDTETAIADLVSTMKAFNIEAKDSMRIVDALNEVANNFSVSAADLGTVLKKSSSTLAISGDSMEQIVAMGTAMNEVLQDEDTTGTTLKMLGLRLRGAKTDVEEAGESVEGMAESTSKLREKVMALTNVTGSGGFDIMLDADNFKTTYDIIQGISKVWGDMAQIDQAALLELIAGEFCLMWWKHHNGTHLIARAA